MKLGIKCDWQNLARNTKKAVHVVLIKETKEENVSLVVLASGTIQIC